MCLFAITTAPDFKIKLHHNIKRTPSNFLESVLVKHLISPDSTKSVLIGPELVTYLLSNCCQNDEEGSKTRVVMRFNPSMISLSGFSEYTIYYSPHPVTMQFFRLLSGCNHSLAAIKTCRTVAQVLQYGEICCTYKSDTS